MHRIVAVAALTLAFAATALAHDGTHAAPTKICVPAQSWGPAPDRERPCLRVLRLHEDGSALVTLGTPHDQVRWYGLPAFDGGRVSQGPIR